MHYLRPLFWLMLACVLTSSARAFDFRINIPKRTKPTQVQQLNRDGVNAIQKHEYETAKKLFYRAYLLDPDDPFTLNNLGYMAEIEGDLERAHRFYDLARQQNSDALVDRADSNKAVGKTVGQVAGHVEQGNMEVNQLNIRALQLLLKDRAPEADVVLTQSLTLDPTNPFTLNNLGFAKEKEGDLEAALQYYSKAAASNSLDPVVVTIHKDWRGRPISAVARDNVENVRMLIREEQGARTLAKVARLNLQGVSALNRNDRRAARGYFEEAYKFDSTDAFTLNNMGYVAEMEGDRESAQFFYAKAQQADHSSQLVGVSNRPEAQGHKLASVADNSQTKVESRMETAVQQRRAKGVTPSLKRRGAAPPASQPPADQNQWQKQPQPAPEQPQQTPQQDHPQ